MDKGETRINKFYVILAVLVLILLIITFIFSGNEIVLAVVDSDYLNEGWGDLGEPTYEERFFGLEKQAAARIVPLRYRREAGERRSTPIGTDDAFYLNSKR